MKKSDIKTIKLSNGNTRSSNSKYDSLIKEMNEGAAERWMDKMKG